MAFPNIPLFFKEGLGEITKLKEHIFSDFVSAQMGKYLWDTGLSDTVLLQPVTE